MKTSLKQLPLLNADLVARSTNTGPGNGSTLSRYDSGGENSEEKGLLRPAAERKRSITAAQGRR